MSEWNDKVIEELRANGGSAPSIGGATLLILHTTGAKSGQERLSPLLYREQGDDLVIFASYAGAPVNPAWFHNLVAHPEVTVEIGGETRVGAGPRRRPGGARRALRAGTSRTTTPSRSTRTKTDREDPGGDPRTRRLRPRLEVRHSV